MKILYINSVCGVTGTGRIVTDLCIKMESQGNQCMVAYGEHKYNNQSQGIETIAIGTMTDLRLHGIMTRLFDLQGFGSKAATRRFLKEVDKFRPDIIHIHNLHGYYINIKLLFDYIKEKNIKTVWTLHDCWPMTGHCVHFSNIACEKWKSQCSNCPLKREYPSSLLVDNSYKNYRNKREIFGGVKDMTLLVPSQWLADKVKESFLRQYRTQVIYNGIDLQQYRRTESDFRKKYGIEDKVMILGVANIWNDRKGLKYFVELAGLLDSNYKIVLVGLNSGQIQNLPEGMIGLERTDKVEELAKIYSAADIFWNPGKEETFGLTVAEAMACGAWPIVFEKTACAEVVGHGTGKVVSENVEEVKKAVLEYMANGKEEHIERYAQFFSKERFAEEILKVYEDSLCQ